MKSFYVSDQILALLEFIVSCQRYTVIEGRGTICWQNTYQGPDMTKVREVRFK